MMLQLSKQPYHLRTAPRRSSSLSLCRHNNVILLIYLCILSVNLPPKCDQSDSRAAWRQPWPTSIPMVGAHQMAGNPSATVPSIVMILPQSFKVPMNSLPSDSNNHTSDPTPHQQYVVVINNAHNEIEDHQIRQKYPKLSLQVREARQPNAGQLFYEHVFDYFPPNQIGQQLLIPVSLDQVSPSYEPASPSKQKDDTTGSYRHGAGLQRSGSLEGGEHEDVATRKTTPPFVPPQQVVVSISAKQSETSVEIVKSSPVFIEIVPSHDGQRSFSIVQTDKPVYKPSEKVRIRALVINEHLRPLVGDEFKLQIRNPHHVVVEELRYPRPPSPATYEGALQKNLTDPLFVDHVFDFPPEPMLGTWTVHLLHSDPIANDTTNFEVKEYVLPPYEIQIEVPKYILPSTQMITGSITSKYHYGKPVQGKVQIKFGFRESLSSKPRYIARSGIKTNDPSTGRVEFKINSDKFKETDWFPALAGFRLVVEATVTETSTGHRETAQDVSSVFVSTPYRISFENSIVDFKSDISQQLTVQLVDSISHQPGPAGEQITAVFMDKNRNPLGATPSSESRLDHYDTEATTDYLGRAVFNFGPVSDQLEQIQVSFKLTRLRAAAEPIAPTPSTTTRNNANKPPSEASATIELASGWHVMNKHSSPDGWIHLMNKTVTHLNIGDEFVSDVLIRDASLVRQKMFYTIAARGQIIAASQLDSDGLVRFRITESMFPSIRLVLMLLKRQDTPLSDSMRINVAHPMNCGLSLEYRSAVRSATNLNYVPPNDAGRLLINARPGDLVSLIGVDSAVYTLNNRTRLDSSRLVERIKRLDGGCGFGGGLDDADVFHNAGLMVFSNSTSYSSAGPSHVGSSCMTVQNQFRYLDDLQMGYTKPIFSRINKLPGASTSGYKRTSRAKRDVAVETILRRYKDPLHRACCRLGTLEDAPHHRNCSVRTKIVQKYMHKPELKSCAQIYQTCCHQVFGEEHKILFANMSPISEMKIEPRIVPQTMQAPQYTEEIVMPNAGQLDQIESHTLVRKDFRETWLFELVPVQNEQGTASIDVKMPHSITAWSVSAMALNRHRPMCLMAQPYTVTAYQEVFIQLSMPYKVVQGEQLDLVANLFNYSPTVQDVVVYMYGVEDVCSEAEPGERSKRKRVRVDKHSKQSVLFPMIPLKTGDYPIKVVAIAVGSNFSDVVERLLHVVPRGRPVTDETTFSLDPMNQQRRSKRAIQTGNLVDEIDSSLGLQRSKVRLLPSRESEYIVPQTHECIVSAIGDKLGQSVQTTILDVENLIRLPRGCGEQVMIYMGPTLYTLQYLSATNKLNGDTRWRAVRYLQSGYKRILNFRKQDGSFSAFAHRDSSVWLTAFVAKLLCQTEKTRSIAGEIHVDKSVVEHALKWLLIAQNKTSGEWTEWNPVYHREMLGGTLKQNVLTAFVTVTLNECAEHAPELLEESNQQDATTNEFNTMLTATRRAEQTLVLNRLNALRDKNPYVLALVAYALSKSNPQESSEILVDLMSLAEKSYSRNHLHWRGDHQIETAAYALQTMIEISPYVIQRTTREKASANGGSSKSAHSLGADAMSVVNWLSSRRSYSGAFESTQDTVVALEALSKFAQLQSSPIAKSLLPQTVASSPSLVCNVTVNNRTRRSIYFGEDNSQILQTFRLDSSDIDSVTGEILDITTSGSGLGTMSVKLKYNVFQEEDELCRFNIDSSIEEWQPKLWAGKRDKFFDKWLGGSSDEGSTEMKDLSAENQNNDTTIEDDYFKAFDKSMLSELNLISESSADLDSNTATNKQGPTQQNKASPILRVRRSQSDEFDILAARAAGQDANESWTTRMVSTLRSKLPSWLVPKHTVDTHRGGQQQAQVMGITSEKPPNHLDSSRRNATTRRSTQMHGAPMINLPTGMPTGAHLNGLSEQLEISSQNSSLSNKTSAQSNNSTSIQIHASDLGQRLVLLLRICVHHMAKRDSEMSVIEVGILSGFKPNEADLKEIINDTGTPAMKYELSPDRSLVIIYLEHIPNSGLYCLQFRLVRDALVYNLQSGYIRVYEYYSPRHSCSNFYTPTRLTDLIRTKCDSTGQVCQCASKSLCPATNRLVDLGEIHQVNTTSARNQLVDLISSNRYDLVSLVRLKSVKYLEVGKIHKLAVKVKSDLKGNLTKIIEAQRQLKHQLIDSVRKPEHTLSTLAEPDTFSSASSPIVEEFTDDDDNNNNSLDLLSLTIDSSCMRDDPYLLHLEHPTQWKQGGELVLFAKSQKLERRLFKTTVKRSAGLQAPFIGPRPKPSVWSSGALHTNPASSSGTPAPGSSLKFDDAQQLQYSLQLPLDKDTILHDITYQTKVATRESMNDLILWLELRSRREKWAS